MAPGFSYKKWYEKNKALLNAGRRLKYDRDPIYRAHVRARNRLARDLEQSTARRLNKRDGVLKSSRKNPYPKILKIDGIYYMTIGMLAERLGWSIQSVRAWSYKGLIPEPKMRSPRGDRLYTVGDLVAIQEILKRAGKRKKAKPKRSRDHARLCPVLDMRTGEVRQMSLVPAAALAKACERVSGTMLGLELRGILPVTPLRRGKQRHRYYTVGMVSAVREAFIEVGGTVRTQEAQVVFRDFVKSQWDADGVFHFKIV